MYGENYSPELERSLDLRNRALDQLINRVLLRQEALRLGLAVTDEEIREAIGKIEGLNADGRFRRDIYFRFVRSQGLSPGEFEEQMSDDLLVRKIQNLYTSSLPIDETTARALYTFSNEKANLSFVELLTTGYHKEVTVTAEEARAYYEKVKESFREPTRAAIEIVAYPNEHFAKAAIVTDEEVKTEYELHKDDRYTQPEEVQARHILFRLEPDADEATRKSVREKADATLARLKKGEDFAKLAKEVSEDDANKEQGGDLGKFPRGRMEESFETAAFALEKGALSDVVETRFGLHLIKVEDKTAQRQKEIDEVREEITERLRGEKSEGFARDAAFTDARAAKGGKTLAELAKAHGLKADTPPPFTETESVVGVPKLPALTKSAFATAPGEIGEAIEGPGVVYVFRVKEKVASHVPDFEKIQTRVETALRDNRARRQGARARREDPQAARRGQDARRARRGREARGRGDGAVQPRRRVRAADRRRRRSLTPSVRADAGETGRARSLHDEPRGLRRDPQGEDAGRSRRVRREEGRSPPPLFRRAAEGRDRVVAPESQADGADPRESDRDHRARVTPKILP